MSRVKVTSEVKCYEIDRVPLPPDREAAVFVRSHWSDHRFVTIAIHLYDGTVGHEVTVAADDLKVAVENARNSG